MKSIQSLASGIFIACVAILSVVSVLGVWSVFTTDVIWKSFETLGVLAAVSVLVVIAGRFLGGANASTIPEPPSEAFTAVRNVTIGVLIVSAVLLAFIGVLSIWNVIADPAVLSRSLSSLAILAFASIVIVMVCLEREKSDLWKRRSSEFIGSAVIGAIILAWILLSTLPATHY